MDSMWKDYMKEEYGREVISTLQGFISYKIHDKECMIYDLFIKKESRNVGAGKNLTDLVFFKAIESGCDAVTCLVDVHGVNSIKGTALVKTYSNNDFKIIGCDNDQIVMKRII